GRWVGGGAETPPESSSDTGEVPRRPVAPSGTASAADPANFGAKTGRFVPFADLLVAGVALVGTLGRL
ncbi:MAG: hypothetical protein ACYDAQ_19460, partial [Mycobacteriales bacterium]